MDYFLAVVRSFKIPSNVENIFSRIIRCYYLKIYKKKNDLLCHIYILINHFISTVRIIYEKVTIFRNCTNREYFVKTYKQFLFNHIFFSKLSFSNET